MPTSMGQQFETKFKHDFSLIPGATIDRLYDPVAGYKFIKNVSDFIGYVYPYIFYLECKSTEQNTFPLANLTQYEDLLTKKDVKGALAGVVIWFVNHKREAWVSIEEFQRIKELGYKSINVKMLDDSEFNVVEIPGIIKRTLIDADYSVIVEQAKLKWGDAEDGK